MLGDLLESALEKIGVTKDRVERWLGRPCGCAERQEKLNQLGYWAKSVLTGKSKHPERHLDGIIGEPTEHRPANPEGEDCENQSQATVLLQQSSMDYGS